jgi:NAD(P)-dependent dehydrogenase (short-subunit alcohol dehydrogenase family)
LASVKALSFMIISLAGQAVVVTGGAVRLGRAIALACARAGAGVAITYHRSETEARATVEEMRAVGATDARFAAVRADLTRREDVQRVAAEAQSTLGEVTALVNNAAIFRRTPFAQMDEDDFDAHIAANLKAPYLLCKAFGDLFLQRGGGAIVNIADIHGLRPLKNYVPYCVSKAGVVMLTQALALALAPQVRVNCVCPGTILPPSEPQNGAPGEADTTATDAMAANTTATDAMAANTTADAMAEMVKRIPLRRLGEPEEIARAVVFLIGGPQFISGVALPVDGAQSLRV